VKLLENSFVNTTVARQCISIRDMKAVTYMQARILQLFEAVFPVRFMSRLCNDYQLPLAVEFESRECLQAGSQPSVAVAKAGNS
jgi:hypothetical protein